MKKTFKGFTLVECLISMAILAIAGALMAGIYSTVTTRNNFNTFNNSSLANQMAYIEKYEKANTVKITNVHSGNNPPDYANNSGTNAYVKITKGSDSYTFPVDIYIMYSRDTHNVGSNNKDEDGNNATYSTMYAESEHNLRYKYLLGH